MGRELYDAAVALAARGWPVIPTRPAGKEPLTRRGVHDATTDRAQIWGWWDRWPDANVGIACGAPGPLVLDIDDPRAAAGLLAQLAPLDPPTAATARGRHLYFAGTGDRTVALDYGELRGRGSYVICPPSVHPSGPYYVWLDPPRGPLPRFPQVAALGPRIPSGCGDRPPLGREQLVPYSQRHPYLRDFCVRLLRAGVTDRGDLGAHLRLEFKRRCAPNPPPHPGYFDALALWGAQTRIAERERAER